MWAKKTNSKEGKFENRHERPTIKNTSRGVLYAEPSDILSSGVAQRQLKVIRESKLLQELRKRNKK